MASLPDAPGSLELSKIAGPWLLAGLLNSGLFGILTVQVYLYYLAFPKDRAVTRGLVYWVYLLEASQTVLLIHDLFETFIRGFADPASLNEVNALWFSIPILTGIVTFTCQGFYAYRISVLMQNKAVGCVIACCCLVQLGAAIAIGIQAKFIGHLSGLFARNVRTTVAVWYPSSALCDVIVAVCMTYTLSRSETNILKTSQLLKRIIRLTVETGTLTAATAIQVGMLQCTV
ncbi:hypothetical protein BDZ97DRAFT_1919566 [Flammula alnicola]|nr:hypothetical protein BDZ97DRAFT_1919566 [Flammula alnicola]